MTELRSPRIENSASSEDTENVLAFADLAGRLGWTRRTFDLYCDLHGLSDGVRQLRWPKRERSMGHELNAYADALTESEFSTSGPRPLSALLMRRFEQNEPLKRAVRALAISDAVHPVDTLRRTGMTARLLARCAEANAPMSPISIGLLAVLYSLCVLLWFVGRSPDYPLLRKATRFAARLSGAS